MNSPPTRYLRLCSAQRASPDRHPHHTGRVLTRESRGDYGRRYRPRARRARTSSLGHLAHRARFDTDAARAWQPHRKYGSRCDGTASRRANARAHCPCQGSSAALPVANVCHQAALARALPSRPRESLAEVRGLRPVSRAIGGGPNATRDVHVITGAWSDRGTDRTGRVVPGTLAFTSPCIHGIASGEWLGLEDAAVARATTRQAGERRTPFQRTHVASSLQNKRVVEAETLAPTNLSKEYFQMPTIVSECYRVKRVWWLPDLGSNQGPAD